MNRPRRVTFVYKEDYPWDVRVEKIVTSLAERGDEVRLLCRNTKGRPRREILQGVEIHRLPGLGRFEPLVGTPAYFNPTWLAALDRCVAEQRADVIMVRDLPLIAMALSVAKRRRAKVVLDMAECYPEMYRSSLQFNPGRWRQTLLKNPAAAAAVERHAIARCDHIFVMIEESRDRLLRLGADPGKVTVVSNTPKLDDGAAPPDRDDRTLRLLYVGFVTRLRGLDNVLAGLREYRRTTPDGRTITLDVIGVGDALAHYGRLARDYGLGEDVRFHGWCSHEFVQSMYRQCHVGVLTYPICSHWNHTIPNKLFDYMLAGMPVLATNIVPIERIVKQTRCGVVFPDRDAMACADCLRDLGDPRRRDEMGAAGAAAVRQTYNWGRDEARMRSALDRVFAES